MKPIQAIIADDEQNLRAYLRSMLADIWPELNIVAEASNGNEALSVIREFEPDVAFLDIKMPGLSGLNVANHISKDCHIVFITAYNEFAVKAFELQAVDYLLKPLEKKRLTETVSRLKNQITQNQSVDHNWENVFQSLQKALSHTDSYIRWIKASEMGKVHIIPVEDVRYFKAGDKYTSVMTKTKDWLIKKPLKELAEELDPNIFWRIHRGVIVNVSYIANASRTIDGRYELQILDRRETLTASRAYAQQFKQM